MERKLIKNATVFDGKSSRLQKTANIVIEGSLVKEIYTGEISEDGFAEIYDAKDHFVMPGLTDAHVHVSHNVPIGSEEQRIDDMAVRSVRYAYDMLMRGFTTLRDAGGVTVGLKRNIDNGYLDGPRIFPSNAYISQTCGHGDCRKSRAEIRLPDGNFLNATLQYRANYIADGPAEMLRAVREQLFLGASQIKLMAGGGISSRYDPLDTVQFTYEEMKAAVDAAEDYGTYVMAHLYTPKAMQRAAKAGIKSFEHATMMDDETGRIIKDLGIWVMPGPQSQRPVTSHGPQPDHVIRKAERVKAGCEIATEVINKYDLPIVFGTDSFGDPHFAEEHQLEDFRYFKRRFGSFKGLVAATGNAHELFKLSTYQNPYPEGKIGVLEAGSFADILIVNGNPAEDLDVLSVQDNMLFIMKNAKVYKNRL